VGRGIFKIKIKFYDFWDHTSLHPIFLKNLYLKGPGEGNLCFSQPWPGIMRVRRKIFFWFNMFFSPFGVIMNVLLLITLVLILEIILLEMVHVEVFF